MAACAFEEPGRNRKSYGNFKMLNQITVDIVQELVFPKVNIHEDGRKIGEEAKSCISTATKTRAVRLFFNAFERCAPILLSYRSMVEAMIFVLHCQV